MAQVLPMIPKSPQTDEGFVRIANELMDAVLSAGFSQRQLLVLLAIIRKTYGYNKKEDDMSAQQIGKLCNMARTHVTTVLNQLAAMNVIQKKTGEYGCVIGIQKDYSRWNLDAKTEPKKEENCCEKQPDVYQIGTSTKSVQVYQIGTKASTKSVQVDSTKSVHTIDNLPKDNLNRQYICAPALFERFYAAYPRKRSRKQAERAFAKLKPDESLVNRMIEAIDVAKKSGAWSDLKFIPYPATWLNAQGWLDVLQTDYTDSQRAVIEEFNDVLGDKLGTVDAAIFVPERACAIDEFLTFSEKPEFWGKYFRWIRDNTELPDMVGFDYLIGRLGFTKVKGGQFTRGEK